MNNALVQSTAAIVPIWEPSTTYSGDQAGLWRFDSSYIAANNACTGVTMKTSSTSNGTVWALQADGSFDRLINRYCDQQKGSNDNQAMEGDNSAGDQYTVGTPASGEYQQFAFHANGG